MKLLLTNDDGIDAKGLAALERACAGLGERVTVAPEACHSSTGHRVTVDRPLRVHRRDVSHFTVDGTPADCVRLTLTHLAPEVELVIAGINHGGNLGADLYMSGTAAAAREAALFGIPAIAVSHYHGKRLEFDWEWAERQVRRVLPELLCRGCPLGHFWSVNLPHLADPPAEAELRFVPVDCSPHPVQYRISGESVYAYSGDYHQRARVPGHDVETCFSGHISASLVTVCGSRGED